jgi:hypothetical protein
MGGDKRADANQPQNLLAVCGDGTRGCHGFIESQRTLALTQGWLLHGHQNPLNHAVNLAAGWSVLRADGSATRVTDDNPTEEKKL